MIPQTIVMKILINLFQIEGAKPAYKSYNRSYTKEFALLALCIAVPALIGTNILAPGEYNRYGLC
jgi:hypothetical protein